MASELPLVASSGALSNITALLPPSLQAYADRSVSTVVDTVNYSSQYIASSLGVEPSVVLYSTLSCVLLAVPLAMSRYGWSLGSPYGSSLGGAVPNITDDDFSYITSEDLEGPPAGSPTTSRYHPRSHSAVPPAPEDDVLLIKNKGVTYPAHFPAYSIGDGKLRVNDVRKRVAIELGLSDRRARRAKILYKGRQLKEPAAPVREYGVKNNSEVMVVLSDAGLDDESSSASDEEMVVVADESGRGSAVGADGDKKRRKKRSKKSKKPRDTGSPRDSASNLSVPGQASDTTAPSTPGGKQVASGPFAKLDELDHHYMSTLHPLLREYVADPPADPKKREDEHRKISETIMAQVLLKLDEIETNGDPDARTRRKELVRKVQDELKELDAKLRG